MNQSIIFLTLYHHFYRPTGLQVLSRYMAHALPHVCRFPPSIYVSSTISNSHTGQERPVLFEVSHMTPYPFQSPSSQAFSTSPLCNGPALDFLKFTTEVVYTRSGKHTQNSSQGASISMSALPVRAWRLNEASGLAEPAKGECLMLALEGVGIILAHSCSLPGGPTEPER